VLLRTGSAVALTVRDLAIVFGFHFTAETAYLTVLEGASANIGLHNSLLGRAGKYGGVFKGVNGAVFCVQRLPLGRLLA
jgi:hypothetical protein